MVNRLGPWIIGLVSLVWAINFGAPFLIKGYNPDPAIHGIFMVIVGGLLGLQSRSNGNGSGAGTEPPKEVETTPEKKAAGGDKP